MKLCLPEVQNMVCQNVDGVSEDRNKLKQGMEPVPMDVGWVHNKEQDEHIEQDDVGAVTINTVCHGYGGYGHLKWKWLTRATFWVNASRVLPHPYFFSTKKNEEKHEKTASK